MIISLGTLFELPTHPLLFALLVIKLTFSLETLSLSLSVSVALTGNRFVNCTFIEAKAKDFAAALDLPEKFNIFQ